MTELLSRVENNREDGIGPRLPALPLTSVIMLVFGPGLSEGAEGDVNSSRAREERRRITGPIPPRVLSVPRSWASDGHVAAGVV